MQGTNTRNTENTAIFEAKGQARRLREALQEMQINVSHSAALVLTARTRGFRNWEEMQGQLASLSPVQPMTPTDVQDQPVDDLRWLDWLEARLRIAGVSEEDLDDLAFESHGDKSASEINNQGMYYQLKARLKWLLENPKVSFEAAKQQLLTDVTSLTGTPLEEPDPNASQKPAIPLRVSVAAGSVHERGTWVDALEWFALAAREDIEQLVCDGLHNSEASDQVGLDLATSSLFMTVREQLSDLLGYGRAAQKLDESVVGITCHIDKASAWDFVTRMLDCGAEFSEETLNKLRC